MRRVAGPGAIVLIVGFALAGCSGGGDKPASTLPPTSTETSSDPVVPPPTTTAPKATPTATQSQPAAQPTKPVQPAVAKQHTKAGAKAMAEYWFDAWQYLRGTGKSGPMRRVSASSCESCTTFADEGDSVLREGGTISMIHRPTLLSLKVTSFSTSSANVFLSYIDGQSRIRIPRTHFDKTSVPPTRSQRRVALNWDGRRWIVSHVFSA